MLNSFLEGRKRWRCPWERFAGDEEGDFALQDPGRSISERSKLRSPFSCPFPSPHRSWYRRVWVLPPLAIFSIFLLVFLGFDQLLAEHGHSPWARVPGDFALAFWGPGAEGGRRPFFGFRPRRSSAVRRSCLRGLDDAGLTGNQLAGGVAGVDGGDAELTDPLDELVVGVVGVDGRGVSRAGVGVGSVRTGPGPGPEFRRPPTPTVGAGVDQAGGDDLGGQDFCSRRGWGWKRGRWT